MWYSARMNIFSMHEALVQRLLDEQIAQNKALQGQLQQQTIVIQQLQHQLATLQAMLFGHRSERRRSKTVAELPVESPPVVMTPVPTHSDESSSKGGRRRLPENLERIKIRYELPEDQRQCPCCYSKLQCIGKEVLEQLDCIPAKLIAKEHIRYKYGCQRCRQYMVTAPMPEQPIDKGLAGAGLLASVLIDKYEDALPLYRQQQRWARLGYALSRSTLCDWVLQCAERLKPIVDSMISTCLLPAHKLHTDDTPFPILSEGKTHTGRLWVYVGKAGNAPPCTIYQYSKTRAQAVPAKFLEAYHGYLQADAYPGYDKLYTSGKIIEVACWAHARRKFTDVAKTVKEPTLANQALDFIGELYGIEKRCAAMTVEQRYYYRRYYAPPILNALSRWLVKQKKQAPPKTPLGLAIQYALNHWKALCNYLRDGILDIDNNRAERAIKPFVIGRKNFLFAGSHRGAEHAAIIYSLIESCKMLNINTFEYFQDVLQRLPTTLNKNISDLFPCYWNPKAPA